MQRCEQDQARRAIIEPANLCEKAACLDSDNGLESGNAYSRNRLLAAPPKHAAGSGASLLAAMAAFPGKGCVER
jgi:hypothetical protein